MSEAPKNKDIQNLYRAVGSAISNWTRIETQLYQIFGICLTLTAKQPGGGWSVDNSIPMAVIDAIDGFRGKLNMIDAALLAAIGGIDDEATTILADWAVVRKKVNGLHWNRNALAHWTAVRWQNPDGTTDHAALAPPPYSLDEHQGVTETDIEGWEEAFNEASFALARIAARLAGHRGLQRKHLAQAASQIVCCLPDDPTLLEFLEHELSGHLKP